MPSELTLEPHPYIESIRRDRDPDGQEGDAVVVVVTSLAMTPSNPNYDADKLAELTRHVEAWQAQYQDRKVTIEGVV